MKTGHTEIRRHANGLIDTDYYIRHCHRERSRAAHRAIKRIFRFFRRLIQDLYPRYEPGD